MNNRYLVVSDLPEYSVFDTKTNRDLFPTKSGNRDYACRSCSRRDADMITNALNEVNRYKEDKILKQKNSAARTAPVKSLRR